MEVLSQPNVATCVWCEKTELNSTRMDSTQEIKKCVKISVG